jgi:hypothetical protein
MPSVAPAREAPRSATTTTANNGNQYFLHTCGACPVTGACEDIRSIDAGNNGPPTCSRAVSF